MSLHQRHGLHFTILGTAAVVLLAIFFLRGFVERAPVERPVARAVEAPYEQAVPVPETDKSEGVAPSPSTGRPEEAPKAKPAPSAVDPGAAARLGEEGRAPGEEIDDATLVRLHGDQPLTQDHPEVAAAIAIQERNTGWLMAHPAVVGTAVGLNDKGEIALMVLTKVEQNDIPAIIEGLPVVIWQSGELVARNRLTTQDDVNSRTHTGGTSGTAKYTRPVPIGISTGHPAITAGTIGCRVKAGTEVFALSNNHVYADENRALLGNNVLQPGTYDGGLNPGDVIGALSAFVTIKFDGSDNTVDAAIALSDTARLGNASPAVYNWTPKSAILAAALKMSVKKVGRTTGQTFGTIKGLNATVNVGYDLGVARFVGQILIGNATFSDGGDSGSLIVQKSGNNPVGLLFAGSSSVTIANKIGNVLTAFGVTVDGN
jgi:hypothetical protein